MPPTLAAHLSKGLARSHKPTVALVGLTLARLVAPEAAHAASVLPSDALLEVNRPQPTNVIQHALPAAIPTISTIPATGALSEVSPSPRFSANQGSVLLAQAITPAADGTGTVVNQTDNTFNITGGTPEGTNLFHSFEQFGLGAGQTANIIINPDIANVLGRVVGGDPSVINGLLQVTGGNANLFLMNPAGIIFGPQAQVIVPGAFTATTASAIEMGEYWFNALGTNEYGNLVAAPSGFAFVNSEPNSAPGAIINAGILQGQSVILLGGFVVNTGTIDAGNGNISIVAVPEEGLVRLTQDNNLLSIDLPMADSLSPEVRNTLSSNLQGLTILDIPRLLSNGNIPQGLGLTLEEGVVKLTATGNPLTPEAGSGASYMTGNNINLGNYSSNVPLIVQSTDRITGNSIEAWSVDLRATNTIDIRHGITGSGNYFLYQNNIDNSILLRTESGDIRVGFIRNEPYSKVEVESGGSIQATDYFSELTFLSGREDQFSIRGGSINLRARDNISLVGGLSGLSIPQSSIPPSVDGAFDGAVELYTELGDIEVGFIQAGWGGIDINSGGMLRITSSFIENDILFDERAFLDDTISVNSDLVNFLVEQGYDREKVEDLTYFGDPAFRGAPPELSLRASASGSFEESFLEENEPVLNAPITIRFGASNVELVNEVFEVSGVPSRILIIGDKTQSFSLGPNYEDNIRFIPSDSSNNLMPYNPETNPNGFDLSQPFSFLPNSDALLLLGTGISGIRAGIAVRGGQNASLYGSVQSRLFSPSRTDNPGGTGGTGGTGEAGGTGGTGEAGGAGGTGNSGSSYNSGNSGNPNNPSNPDSTPDLASIENLDIADRNVCDNATASRSLDSDILEIDERLVSALPTQEGASTANPCTSSATPATPTERSAVAPSFLENTSVEVPNAAIGREPRIDASAINLSIETADPRPIFSDSPAEAP